LNKKKHQGKTISKIILSCGHEVNDFTRAYHIMTKDTDRYGARAIMYQTVCGPCEDRYRQQGQIFDFEEVAYMWVSKDENMCDQD
jgi:hypothetical protein